jgi:hypothetical protein
VTQERDTTQEQDTKMTSIYIQVLALEAVIIVALWVFGRMFS